MLIVVHQSLGLRINNHYNHWQQSAFLLLSNSNLTLRHIYLLTIVRSRLQNY